MANQLDFIPILFGILFAFVFLNLVICSLLYFFYSKKTYRFLSLYWFGVLLVFLVQSQFQTKELNIMFAAGISFFPLSILAKVVFDSFKEHFPFRSHLVIFIFSYPIMNYLYKNGFGFTLAALPGGLAISTPLLHALYLLVYKKWNQATYLQKMLVLPYIAFVIHIINFCLFRMDANAQLWGWTVSFAIYQLLGILLPAFVLEETHRTENTRLMDMVHDKTQELILSHGGLETVIKEKDALFRVLIHDISNPLTALIDNVEKLKLSIADKDALLMVNKAEQLTNHLYLIISHLKQIEGRKIGKLCNDLSAVSPIDSINKILEIFEFALEKKELQVKIINKTSDQDPLIMADETLLASSVFSNIISNAIKFSLNKGLIIITLTEQDENFIKLSFKDYGVGMSSRGLSAIFDDHNPTTKPGTLLERGLGLGMPIVKMYVEAFLGKIEVHSTESSIDVKNQGTEVILYLKRANQFEVFHPTSYLVENPPSPFIN